MVEHLQDCAVHRDAGISRSSCEGGSRNPQHHETHVIDRRIRDKPLEICLPIGAERPKNNRRGGKEGQRKGEMFRFSRVERQHKPEESVRAQL